MGCCGIIRTDDNNNNNNNHDTVKHRISQSKNTDVRKNFEFISMLGNGAYGKVRLYRDRNYKDLLFAIKTLKKEGIPQYQFNLLKSEVNILSNLDHPNIVKYFGVFEDDYYVHIVMEYLKGYDLYKIISLKKYTGFDEKDMCEIIQQLLKALSFIHSQNIIHRDIKPENILFANKRDYSTLKLIDFGLATNKKKDTKSVGTPFYMSPEMIDGNSYPQSDIWSVGIIVYLMLTGRYAFDAKDGESLFEKIKNDTLDMQPLIDSECSEEAKDFITKCLKKKYSERMTTAECLEHAWINKFCIKKDSNLLNNDTVDTLLDFANKNALQKEIYYFIAKISSESDINKLKVFFNQIDVDNSGTLTLEEVEKAFKAIDIDITNEELKQIWEGLDFHKDGQVNYSEFLAAMVSSYNFQKEEKLWSVFNLFKEGNKNKNYITYDSLYNAAKALNLNINESEIKKCFEKYDEAIDFETFKKLILESELEDKNFKEGTVERSDVMKKSNRRKISTTRVV
jgi:calcium-dependent protein kinase